jgi:uncharacterized protein (DUF302 family)
MYGRFKDHLEAELRQIREQCRFDPIFEGGRAMSYYFSTTIGGPFDAAVDRVKAELKKEGFGVLTEIDVRKTLKEKLNVDFRNYRILGSCNPPFAYKALLAEDKIGLMLPCNVIVQDTAEGRVEVAAIDPIASMAAVPNPALEAIGQEVRAKLAKVIAGL